MSQIRKNVFLTLLCASALLSFASLSSLAKAQPDSDEQAIVSDRDEDGKPDDQDNCPDVFNPSQVNTNMENPDSDSLGDSCNPDIDGDEYNDDTDNCPLIYNPDQKDSSNPKNHIGDACEVVEGDADSEIVIDSEIAIDDFEEIISHPLPSTEDVDANEPLKTQIEEKVLAATTPNLPPPLRSECRIYDKDGNECVDKKDAELVINALNLQEEGIKPDMKLNVVDDFDLDGDKEIDPVLSQIDVHKIIGCINKPETCPRDCICVPNDDDRDLLTAAKDNCPKTYNPDQRDTNSNGIGDACEDRDSDGVFDLVDNCPNVVNPSQYDGDQDQIGNLCDENGCEYYSVTLTSELLSSDIKGEASEKVLTLPCAKETFPICFNPNSCASTAILFGLTKVCHSGDNSAAALKECQDISVKISELARKGIPFIMDQDCSLVEETINTQRVCGSFTMPFN